MLEMDCEIKPAEQTVQKGLSFRILLGYKPQLGLGLDRPCGSLPIWDIPINERPKSSKCFVLFPSSLKCDIHGLLSGLPRDLKQQMMVFQMLLYRMQH